MEKRELTFADAVQLATLLLKDDAEIYSSKDGTPIEENPTEVNHFFEKVFKLADLILEHHQRYVEHCRR